jgi:hypothetical protein
MKTLMSLLVLFILTASGQVKLTPADALSFAELKAVKIKAIVTGGDEVMQETTLQSRAFIELRKQLPVLQIEGDGEDIFQVSLFLNKLAGKEQNLAKDFYFAELSVQLRRRAVHHLSGSYYGGTEPVYAALVWDRVARFWGPPNYIDEKTKKYLEDIMTAFALDYYTATAQLEKNRDSVEVKQY